MDMQTWRDGHDRATDAADAIRAALIALGVSESEWSGIRPTVTRTGRPYVHLGQLPADVVEQLAELLRRVATPEGAAVVYVQPHTSRRR
ncbi:hypothetical protein [Streptomyces sp. NPDC059564]|uniref:hypothetical protein n=1 Tax=Streptomyces sp. NPDC059564 TaxID=3346865 RepID=UPI0036C51B67